MLEPGLAGLCTLTAHRLMQFRRPRHNSRIRLTRSPTEPGTMQLNPCCRPGISRSRHEQMLNLTPFLAAWWVLNSSFLAGAELYRLPPGLKN